MVLLWSKRMMDDEPAAGGNDEPYIPELVENEATTIEELDEGAQSSGGGISSNLINYTSDKGYVFGHYKTETWHDFTPSFLNHSDESSEEPTEPDEPVDPPSDPQVNI